MFNTIQVTIIEINGVMKLVKFKLKVIDDNTIETGCTDSDDTSKYSTLQIGQARIINDIKVTLKSIALGTTPETDVAIILVECVSNEINLPISSPRAKEWLLYVNGKTYMSSLRDSSLRDSTGAAKTSATIRMHNGLNLYVKGTTNGYDESGTSKLTLTDSCDATNSQTIWEAVCTSYNIARKYSVNCPNGMVCRDGVCVANKEIA